jgi:hypothetical protein
MGAGGSRWGQGEAPTKKYRDYVIYCPPPPPPARHFCFAGEETGVKSGEFQQILILKELL